MDMKRKIQVLGIVPARSFQGRSREAGKDRDQHEHRARHAMKKGLASLLLDCLDAALQFSRRSSFLRPHAYANRGVR
jgi:hypothetical protein